MLRTIGRCARASRCRWACVGSRSLREVDQPQPVFRPGEQSTLYPSAPPGLLYAGDPGIPRGGHPTLWGNVAPRLAAAWSVAEKTSIPTAYGRFSETARFFNLPQTIWVTHSHSVSLPTHDV